jgi:hypothetical protein
MRSTTRIPLAALGAMALLALSAFPQSAKLQFNLDHLAKSKNIVETVNVTLDSNLLTMFSSWLPRRDPETARIRQLVQGLQGVYVRSFKFDKEGAYSLDEVEAIRRQLVAPAWSCIVQVRTKRGRAAASREEPGDGDADVCLRQQDGKILGLAIIAVEPKELTVVNIVGSLTPEQLSDLEGHFGIPAVRGKDKPSKAPKAKEPGKDEY